MTKLLHDDDATAANNDNAKAIAIPQVSKQRG